MGPVGVQEMIVIFLVALVLFGPKKLPELGKTIGKAITEFRRAQSELKSTFESHMRELEKENDSIKQLTKGVTDEIYSHYTGYDASYYESGAFGTDPKPATDAATLSPSETAAPEPSIVNEPAGIAHESAAGQEHALAQHPAVAQEPHVAQEAAPNGTVPRSTTSAAVSEVVNASAAEPDSHTAQS